MKLLIVGASGFIGTAIYQLAERRGIDVYGTATTAAGAKYIPYRMDEDEPEKLLNALERSGKEEATFAVLAAAITNIKKCYEEQEFSYKVNVQGVCKLAEVFWRHNIRSVFLSSDAVFDGVRGDYSEEDLPTPTCVYGRQKAEAEQRLMDRIPNILIYRLGKQVDSFQRTKSLFNELYYQYQQEKIVHCVKGLKFNPTYLYDTAKCILTGLLQRQEGLFHVANPEVYSRTDLAKMLFDRMKLDVEIVEDPVEAFNFDEQKPLNTSMRIDKFQSIVSYPFRSIESIADLFVKNFYDGGSYADRKIST